MSLGSSIAVQCGIIVQYLYRHVGRGPFRPFRQQIDTHTLTHTKDNGKEQSKVNQNWRRVRSISGCPPHLVPAILPDMFKVSLEIYLFKLPDVRVMNICSCFY